MIYVGIVGALSSMGQMIREQIKANPLKYKLLFTVDSAYDSPNYVEAQYRDSWEALAVNTPGIVFDFSHPDVVLENVKACRYFCIPVIVGTTGWTQEKMQELKKYCQETGNGSPIVILPDFLPRTSLMFERALRVAEQEKDSIKCVEFNVTGCLNKDDVCSGYMSRAMKMAQILGDEEPKIEQVDDYLITVGHKIRLYGLSNVPDSHTETGVYIEYSGGEYSEETETTTLSEFWPGLEMTQDWLLTRYPETPDKLNLFWDNFPQVIAEMSSAED